MAGLDDLTRRLASEPGFADALARDPRSALVGQELTVDELTELARWVEEATARLDPSDQRRSRAGFFALLAVAPNGAARPPDHVRPDGCPSGPPAGPPDR